MNLRILAYLISAFCHPLLLPTAVCAVCFYAVPLEMFVLPQTLKAFWLLIMAIMTFIVPMVGILLYYFIGSIQSLSMADRKDRLYPFILTTCVYAMSTWLLMQDVRLAYLPLLAWFLGGVTVTLAVVTCITFYWKVSAHSAGMMGVVGLWAGLAYRFSEPNLLYLAMGTLVLAGIVMSARLYLNAHTPNQISVGAVLGFGINYVCTLLAVIFFM
jgi:membrane-associated phospholipid phosphatase